ncbi:MAG: KH domain-containing protein [Erysipelotrichaceae bacterium]|jgi:predicted RNA-binding protein YlqC (UPF0109 family)|nr:KH domain-containing protein [Erysipelotrichaceae bacterium]
MDYEAILHTIVDDFIVHKDALIVRKENKSTKNNIFLLVCAEQEDVGRLIGKRGVIANAIRELLNVAGKLENKRVFLKFESLTETSE